LVYEGNRFMRTVKCVLTAAAVTLPLLLGAAGTALAAGEQGHPVKPPKASWIQKQAQEQSAANHTVQNNINVSPVTQVSNGSAGEQSAMTWTQQNNWNDTDQTEEETQTDD
jgi:hypothetical protein